MLPERQRPRARGSRGALAAIGAAIVVVATIAAACGDDPGVNPTDIDSGGTPGVPGDGVLCPDAAPEAGEGCVLPEGTTCAFGACGSPIAQCSLGAWRYSGNPQPRCPRDFPVSESACPPCWPTGLECTYGSVDCSAADASANTTVASCVDGGPDVPLRWSLRTFPCAIVDAGADVQHDAEPDAD
ncbi:MAG: hypothetical protein KF850_36085 [Labilithrix sp.]|nr:hypothetical protein [Labilithrix sp.]